MKGNRKSSSPGNGVSRFPAFLTIIRELGRIGKILPLYKGIIFRYVCNKIFDKVIHVLCGFVYYRRQISLPPSCLILHSIIFRSEFLLNFWAWYKKYDITKLFRIMKIGRKYFLPLEKVEFLLTLPWSKKGVWGITINNLYRKTRKVTQTVAELGGVFFVSFFRRCNTGKIKLFLDHVSKETAITLVCRVSVCILVSALLFPYKYLHLVLIFNPTAASRCLTQTAAHSCSLA